MWTPLPVYYSYCCLSVVTLEQVSYCFSTPFFVDLNRTPNAAVQQHKHVVEVGLLMQIQIYKLLHIAWCRSFTGGGCTCTSIWILRFEHTWILLVVLSRRVFRCPFLAGSPVRTTFRAPFAKTSGIGVEHQSAACVTNRSTEYPTKLSSINRIINEKLRITRLKSLFCRALRVTFEKSTYYVIAYPHFRWVLTPATPTLGRLASLADHLPPLQVGLIFSNTSPTPTLGRFAILPRWPTPTLRWQRCFVNVWGQCNT